MLTNLKDNLSASSDSLLLLVTTAAALAVVALRLVSAQRTLGTLRFVGPLTKWIGALALIGLVLQLVHLNRPYTVPPSNQVAFVLGNTQNTPKPELLGKAKAQLEESLLLHKGDAIEDLVDSFVFISAVGEPQVVRPDPNDISLVPMSVNDTRAARDARRNAAALSDFATSLSPTGNGANYVDGIFTAIRNVDPGATINIIGSGLSDSGDVDFAHSDLLLNESRRDKVIENLSDKYGRNYLSGYSLVFFGLGDTQEPQEDLSPKQRDIVRDFYEELVRALGGRPRVETRTQTAEATRTRFSVSTTDTGCGVVDLVFGEQAVEFVSDQATFKDEKKMQQALGQVVRIYNRAPTRVSRIKVDGYIYDPSGKAGGTLSRDRADAVRSWLVSQGIPGTTIVSAGKGAGPHKDPNNPGLDRMVKVEINRATNPDC